MKKILKIMSIVLLFKVWSIKGESINDRIAIKGFMFPADTYSRIK